MKGNTEAWKYQPAVVAFSSLCFMAYFFILREENHIDKAIGQSLHMTVPQLEEATIAAAIQANRLKGIDTIDLEKRLKEIQALKD